MGITSINQRMNQNKSQGNRGVSNTLTIILFLLPSVVFF